MFKNCLIGLVICGLLLAACASPTQQAQVAAENATMEAQMPGLVSAASTAVAQSPEALATQAVGAAVETVQLAEPVMASVLLHKVYLVVLPEEDLVLAAGAVGSTLPQMFKGNCGSAIKLANHMLEDGGRRLISRFGGWEGLDNFAQRLGQATVKAVAMNSTGRKVAIWLTEGADEFVLIVGKVSQNPTIIPLAVDPHFEMNAAGAAARLLGNITRMGGESGQLLAVSQEILTSLGSVGTILTAAQLADAALQLAAFGKCLSDESRNRGGKNDGNGGGAGTFQMTPEQAQDAALETSQLLIVVGVSAFVVKVAISVATMSPVPLLVPVP